MAAFVARYACAFADVVSQEKLDAAAIERQIDDFIATWNGSAELRELFVNPAVAAVQKVAVLDKLNVKFGLQRRLGIRPVEIVTARELSAEDRTGLLGGVEKLAGARIAASFKLDTSILGGTVVRIGSTVYDGSVRGRLERLKEALIAG